MNYDDRLNQGHPGRSSKGTAADAEIGVALTGYCKGCPLESPQPYSLEQFLQDIELIMQGLPPSTRQYQYLSLDWLP